jgi:hypothetical protein
VLIFTELLTAGYGKNVIIQQKVHKEKKSSVNAFINGKKAGYLHPLKY